MIDMPGTASRFIPPKSSSVPHNDWYPPAGASADRTTKSGNPIGRPRLSRKFDQAIAASLASGKGILKTAREVRVGVGKVQRVKRALAEVS